MSSIVWDCLFCSVYYAQGRYRKKAPIWMVHCGPLLGTFLFLFAVEKTSVNRVKNDGCKYANAAAPPSWNPTYSLRPYSLKMFHYFSFGGLWVGMKSDASFLLAMRPFFDKNNEGIAVFYYEIAIPVESLGLRTNNLLLVWLWAYHHKRKYRVCVEVDGLHKILHLSGKYNFNLFSNFRNFFEHIFKHILFPPYQAYVFDGRRVSC